MRRVAVTGLGAVTPLGNDARATWQAAVEGRSGIDWIRSFDASEFPVRVAAEVKDFDPSAVASPKEVRKLERNVLLSLGAGGKATPTPGLTESARRGAGAASGPAAAASKDTWDQPAGRRDA